MQGLFSAESTPNLVREGLLFNIFCKAPAVFLDKILRFKKMVELGNHLNSMQQKSIFFFDVLNIFKSDQQNVYKNVVCSTSLRKFDEFLLGMSRQFIRNVSIIVVVFEKVSKSCGFCQNLRNAPEISEFK